MTTVIVPVYNAPDELAECLASLRRTLAAAVPVIVIDDASTDPRVDEVLHAAAAQAPAAWQFLSNPLNRGFVGTVNRGIAACHDDVVLLNSDTRVTTGWLQRLEACAASDKRIATITPFTNNGEIASWPHMCQANPWPHDPDLIAAACQRAGAPQYPDLPTAVGFCMWIRRRALRALGLFDEQGFGRGYGEENDFSQRAQQAGWRNVLCDDAYVAHRGGASFLPLGLTPNGAALAEVKRRHPDYLQQVMTFIRQDPLRHRREAILRCLTPEQCESLGIGVSCGG